MHFIVVTVLFLAVLAVLVIVHEAGHFFAAKLAGMRVEEFGIGFPPRALTFWKKGETEYTLNWLPIGGFVRIYGEDGVEGAARAHHGRAFSDKNRFVQACVLVAGIVMNFILAFVLFAITFAIPAQRSLTDAEAAQTPGAVLSVEQVLPGSPAAGYKVQAGDIIKKTVVNGVTIPSTSAQAFISIVENAPAGTPVGIDLIRDGQEILVSPIPVAGIVPNNASQRALGLIVAPVGVQADSWYQAIIDGATFTWDVTKATAIGLLGFLGGVLSLHADLSQVAGPIGIAIYVGSAAQSGAITLLSLMAFISINLGLVNVLPFPALDGGRVLFVIIEAITRRRIKPSVARSANGIGFALLMLLVFAVTAHDVYIHLV